MNWNNLLQFSKVNEVRNLAFIFGCPRGGTTWVWSLLESHPDVLPFLLDYNLIDGKYSSSESGVYVKRQKSAKIEISNLVKNHPDKLIIEKTPIHLFHYNQIKKDFPKSTNIIIFRNPLAIVNSMLHSNMDAFKNHDINKSIDEVKRYYYILTRIYKHPNTFYITYESLFSNLETEILRLLKFLNLSLTSVDKILKENGFPKISVEGAFRKIKPNSYLDELNKEELHFLNRQLEKEITIFNKINFENFSS